ncbi:T9SS type A sorting domain-containing protein [Cryomorphaceae bacterium 1068]|nr:T9SS type A sorting domain-containing protein [Cryomorphaceae bacterium 1068]
MKNLYAHCFSILIFFAPFLLQAQLVPTESVIQGTQNAEQYYDVAIDVLGANTSSLYIGYGVVAGTADIIVKKEDGIGVTEWIRNYDSSGSEFGHRIIFTSDGGFAFTGWTTANGSDDLLVVKCESDGTIEWTKAIGGSGIERGRDLKETADGDLIVTGHTNTLTMGVNDILVVKLNADGEVLWRNRYGGSGNENGWGVETLSDGSHIIAGNIGSVGPGFTNLALLKIDADGTLIWLRGFGSDEGATAATSMDIDFEDNIYVGGWTDAAGAGDRDVYAAVFDSDGTLINDMTAGGNGFETSNDIDEYSAFAPNNMVLVGKTGSFDENNLMRPFLVWLNATGEGAVNFRLVGSGIEDGELFGIEVNVPLDLPGVITTGLTNFVDTENIDTYRFRGTIFGACLESNEVVMSSPGFDFEEGGMSEIDESAETEPSFTNDELNWEEVIECQETIGLNSDLEKPVLRTYPNPTDSEFLIEGCENTLYRVFDVHGKLVEQGIYDGQPISVADWNKGFYFIRTDQCGTAKIFVNP